MRTAWRRVLAVIWRDMLITRTYPLQFFLGILSQLVGVTSFYFIGEFVGQPSSLREADVGYFEFVLIGMVVVTVTSAALKDVSRDLMAEQNQGTLEMLLVTPAPLWSILSGSILGTILFESIDLAILLGIGAVFAGIAFGFEAIIALIVILPLTFAAFTVFGLVATGILLVVKRGDPISGTVHRVVSLLSGAYFPISVMPFWLQLVSWTLPSTYALRSLRRVMLENSGLQAIVQDVAILATFAAVGLPLASLWLRRSLAAAKRAGVLTSY